MPQEDMELFDRGLLRVRQERAASSLGDHGFLLARAAEDIRARLDAVMRDFPLSLLTGMSPDALARMLGNHPRMGRLVLAGPRARELTGTGGLSVACDEERLPFATGAFALAVSVLSLHLVNDLPGALLQLRRALRPDGLLMAAVLGGGTLHELREALTAAEVEVTGGASPRVAPFADVRDYGALLQRAGFALPVADSDSVTATYRDIIALMHDLRGMGATNVLRERSRRPLQRSVLLRAGEIYAERFPAGGGRIAATFEIIHLSGWVPHGSQQKPLAPGTARMRLADALNTKERSAGVKAGPEKTRH